MAKKLYFLIGFPGCGKTTLGKKWAEKYHLPWVDLDEFIENQENQLIAEIFSQKGEDYFREIEKAYLHQLVEISVSPSIISCGGGTPCFFDNHDYMKKNGETIFIHTPLEIILQRLVAKNENRPLFHQNQAEDLVAKARILYHQRLPEYLTASTIIENEVWEI